jgi:hypothetical protein
LNDTGVAFGFIALIPALISVALLVFTVVMLRRLVSAAEGARDALRDLADRFPKMS